MANANFRIVQVEGLRERHWVLAESLCEEALD